MEDDTLSEVEETDIASEIENVAEAAEDVMETLGANEGGDENRTIDFLLDVPLAVTVEVGRARMTIQDLLQLGQGSVVELEKLAGEPLDIFINGRIVAKGEAVIINEKFGVRLLEIIPPSERLAHLR